MDAPNREAGGILLGARRAHFQVFLHVKTTFVGSQGQKKCFGCVKNMDKSFLCNLNVENRSVSIKKLMQKYHRIIAKADVQVLPPYGELQSLVHCQRSFYMDFVYACPQY